MQYRLDPRTGNRLSVLGFGLMRLPRTLSGIDQKKAEQMILTAIDSGVNYFDTAYLYPGSEAALGKVIEAHPIREKVFIATKLPIVNVRAVGDLDRFFAAHLERLHTEYIDYYLMHNINTLAQWQALVDLGIESWLKEKRESGAVKSIGFSFHGSLDEFLKVLNAYDWDFCQIQLNYAGEHDQAGVSGLERAAERGIPVIIMEPLLGGKLATGLPAQAVGAFRAVDPSLTPAAWGLRWLLNRPEVTVILSGMSDAAQLADNIKTADASHIGMLTEREQAAYREVIELFRAIDKVHCTGCGYCLNCPKHVNIPGCFAAYNTSYRMGRLAGIIQYTTSTSANRPENRTASRCVSCGQCLKHCPQAIDIPRELKAVEKRLEPFYFKWAMSLIRRRSK